MCPGKSTAFVLSHFGGSWLMGLMALTGGPYFSCPVLQDPVLAAARAASDDALALALEAGGLPAFLRFWYSAPMWASLAAHPHFKEVLARRGEGAASKEDEGGGRLQCEELAASLRFMSPGRMVSGGAEWRG